MRTSFLDWFHAISEQYGVDPLIFAVIYIVSMPAFMMSVGWIVRRLLLGRPLIVPVISAAFFYLSSYLYIFIAGRDIPLWFYGLLLVIIAIGSTFSILNIRKRAARIKPQDTTHDVIVLGGGAGGIAAARLAGNLGTKVLLVEHNRLGGDSTWNGCIPSKTLLRAARAVHDFGHGSRFGLSDHSANVDFPVLMEHLRSVQQHLYETNERPEVLRKSGVEVAHGHACFLDQNTVEIETDDGDISTATGRYVIIATGGRPRIPDIPGLHEVDFLTNRTLFELEEQPENLLILGAGPVGMEMAQAFQRLGTNVTVIEQAGRPLPHEDGDVVQLLQDQLEADGVTFFLNAVVNQASQADDGTIRLKLRHANAEHVIKGSALLVATGRRANVEKLRLEAAGVEFTDEGIKVNDSCRTNRRPVFAIGDVTGRYQFTHMSEHMAKKAVVKMLLKLPQRIETGPVPHVTYTDPELAHVGSTQTELDAAASLYEVYRFPYDRLDRAVTEGDTHGEIRLYAHKFSGKILGATILGRRAGELISEVGLAMRNGIPIRKLSDTIHAYPTYSQGVRRAADQWYIAFQSRGFLQWVQKMFGYRGQILEQDIDDKV